MPTAGSIHWSTAPKAGRCLEEFVACIVIDEDAFAARHDRRPGVEKFSEIGLRMNEARLIDGTKTVGQLGHERILQWKAAATLARASKSPNGQRGNAGSPRNLFITSLKESKQPAQFISDWG